MIRAAKEYLDSTFARKLKYILNLFNEHFPFVIGAAKVDLIINEQDFF